MESRIKGVLYGQLVGDALGTRYEFTKDSSKLLQDTAKGQLEILGGGPQNVVPGQVTDDSEMALALAHKLLENCGYNRTNIAEAYVEWHNSRPWDQGAATRMSLLGSNDAMDMINSAKRYNRKSLSNGTLMRISPLGIYGAGVTNEELFRVCELETKLTHPHELATEASKVFCIAIKTGILTGNSSAAYNNAVRTAKSDILKEILYSAKQGSDEIPLSDGLHIDIKNQTHIGYLGVALLHAFRELIYFESFEKSMYNVMAYGGDADTNGCITGALLGAVYGYKLIPKTWIKTVSTTKNERQRMFPYIKSEHFPTLIQGLIDIVNHDEFRSKN